jgi:transposase
MGEGDYSEPGSKVNMQAELKRLRKENKRLKMEREILKKAAAFFAKESG